MIPLCFFGASLTGKQAAGVLLIIAGLILTKI
jgi:multidrug transporter EmrE-like cation transporter